MRKLILTVLLSIAAAGQAAAQTAPADAPATPLTVIHAGMLLDRPGEQPRGPASILVRDGRIEQVVDGHIAPPADATLIDLADRFVLPGFIDVHVHFTSDWQNDERLPADSSMMTAYWALVNARKTLEAGFTTVRNLGDQTGTTMALRDAIARGWVVGPRMLDVGAAIAPTYGHGDPRRGQPEDVAEHIHPSGNCDSYDACLKATRLQIGRGADAIKIVATGLSSDPVGPELGGQMTQEEIDAVVEVAHQAGLKVAAHAHGGAGLRRALAAGVDSIEHGYRMYLFEGDLEALRESGAHLVPTLSTMGTHLERLRNPDLDPELRRISEQRMEVGGQSLQRALRMGVPVSLGTDAGVSAHGGNALEFELFVEYGGLTPMQAIEAGTVNAAELLDLADEIGSIEPGKSADIVAVTGDPLTDITRLQSVEFVMKQGVVYMAP